MATPSRRELLKLAGTSAAGAAVFGLPAQVVAEESDCWSMPIKLPDLPYPYDALEPVLDEKTLRIHHGKHHAGYVNGLNATLDKLEAARKAGDYAAIQGLSRALAFHGSGHVLHTLYFANLTPKPDKPAGKLLSAIKKSFGSVETMTAQLTAATIQVAGSGWGMLATAPMSSRLLILQIEKHENQMVCGAIPLLLIDVWEHAYYVKYQNMRADYVKGIANLINWAEVGKRFEVACKV